MSPALPPFSPSSRLPPGSLAYAFWQAADLIARVRAGRSLADNALQRVSAAARPAVQDLVYTTLRAYGRGDFLLTQLLERPLTQPAVHALLLAALERLEKHAQHAHTIVDQAVLAAGEMARGRLRGLVNAVLRNFLRRQEALRAALKQNPLATGQHPAWWQSTLQNAWPEQAASILAAGNTPPPMAVRVNLARIRRTDYQKLLLAEGIAATPHGEAGLCLAHPVPVDRLPGFFDGWASVQDPGAQRAAEILRPAPGARVLDACAAPGGKTAHLLETTTLDLLALDRHAARCRHIEETLARLHLSAQVRTADCSQPASWWDGRPFDAILADVPCTASGVVRRHPDAKWLRREDDIASFSRSQKSILEALWPLLRPGGQFLYATCSLFPAENQQQISDFLARHADAERLHEEQLFPNATHDGFFYSLLGKRL
ncbi:16S rRNA (cytosine(967)-C(5))-methyltransferase RsmB [Azonexus sp.]|uniref:16S rRNA (cytosine(967)-C(5))-methyltransferase RsmB n=1 Tax=Azonexus sp. TaxID=1872668 RepID=UPI0039E341E1